MGEHPYIIVLKGVFVSNPVLVHWSRCFKTTSSDWFARAEWVEWMQTYIMFKASVESVYVVTLTARRGRQRSCTVGLNAAFPLRSWGSNSLLQTTNWQQKIKNKHQVFLSVTRLYELCKSYIRIPQWTEGFASSFPGNSSILWCFRYRRSEYIQNSLFIITLKPFSLKTQGKPGRLILSNSLLFIKWNNQQHIDLCLM